MTDQKSNEKKKKSRILDIIFYVAIAAILFTPAGKPIKIWVNKVFAFSPSVKNEDNREVLSDYQWQFTDDNGNPFNLSEAKGKVIFINYWATWCPPCIAEMPSIQKLYNQYKDNPNVVFVFATTDPKDKVDQFMQDNNYTLPSYYIISGAPEQLESNTIPFTALIAKDGSIAIKKKGSADWNSKKVRKTIDKLVAEG